MKHWILAALLMVGVIGGAACSATDDVDSPDTITSSTDILTNVGEIVEVQVDGMSQRFLVTQAPGHICAVRVDGKSFPKFDRASHYGKLRRYVYQFAAGDITEAEFQGYILDLQALDGMRAFKHAVMVSPDRSHPKLL